MDVDPLKELKDKSLAPEERRFYQTQTAQDLQAIAILFYQRFVTMEFMHSSFFDSEEERQLLISNYKRLTDDLISFANQIEEIKTGEIPEGNPLEP